MSMVTDSATFIITRCAIGFALACFVCCQFWSSCMFSPNVVGTANAFAGGWGNLGACPVHRPLTLHFPAPQQQLVFLLASCTTQYASSCVVSVSTSFPADVCSRAPARQEAMLAVRCGLCGSKHPG